jgi:hypothetical protein
MALSKTDYFNMGHDAFLAEKPRPVAEAKSWQERAWLEGYNAAQRSCEQQAEQLRQDEAAAPKGDLVKLFLSYANPTPHQRRASATVDRLAWKAKMRSLEPKRARRPGPPRGSELIEKTQRTWRDGGYRAY